MRPLVVVGDVLLDVDVETSAERLSPDGPVPVLDEHARIERAGGAALAAALAARESDAPVILISAATEDDAFERVRALLDPAVELLALPAAGSTPTKTRLRCGASTVARLDRGTEGARVLDLPPAARAVLSGAGAVLVSDYGVGVTACDELRTVLTELARHTPIVWDPHPRGGRPVPGALVTPNAPEAARATGVPGDDLRAVRHQAQELLRRWDARAVAITLGSRGALFVDGSGRCTAVAPPQVVTGDACGAGDCFAAATTAALLGQALPSEAVARGVAAATRFLAAGGASAPVDGEPASGSPEQVVAGARAQGRTVVATGGCFDLLHAGHVAMLTAARRLGDCLVVCLNSDASVRRLKGPGRPLQPAADRAEVLRSLRAVDAVVVFDEDTPEAVLDRLRPDIWVKGDDYAGAELPEAQVVRRWGGEVITVPYLAGRSTSSLVELSRR